MGGPPKTRFQLSLRAWLIVLPIIAGVVGWQSRHAVLTPRNVASLNEVATLDEDIWEIAWSPERDRMAVLGWEKPAEIRDALTLEKIDTLGEKLIHFAFSPDKDVVAYCKNGKEAEILDRKTGRTIVLDAGNSQPQMAFSPDGKAMATGGSGHDGATPARWTANSSASSTPGRQGWSDSRIQPGRGHPGRGEPELGDEALRRGDGDGAGDAAQEVIPGPPVLPRRPDPGGSLLRRDDRPVGRGHRTVASGAEDLGQGALPSRMVA